MKPIILVCCLALIALDAPAQGVGKDQKKKQKSAVAPKAPPPASKQEVPAPKQPLLEIRISTLERKVIREEVGRLRSKDAKSLPPGLAKKVERGGSLPPGWQKKIARGEVMPIEVFKAASPVPKRILIKLPPPPGGTILVAIDGKVVRLLHATRQILDVFEL